MTDSVEISVQVIGGFDDGHIGRIEITLTKGKRPLYVRNRGVKYRLREALTGNYLIHPDCEKQADMLLGKEES